MASTIPVGTRVHVTVPASSANLGPGFDTLGLALSLYDDVDVEVIDSGLDVIIHGEGENDLPTDDRHLVVRAVRTALAEAGASAPGLRLTCHNRIPQSRGLGSSAAAAVAGVVAGNALAGFPLDDAAVIHLSSVFEGHPDNAAASVLGGAIVGWTEDYEQTRFKAVPMPVHPDIKALALVPAFHASTKEVRKVLPDAIPHVDARFNVSRTSLMTIALRDDPSLLMEATRDRLHQPYRAQVLPLTAEWVNRLRRRGYAAYLSGAGPTIVALTTEHIADDILDAARAASLKVLPLTVAGPVTAEVSYPS